MRYDTEHKQRTREKILDAAALAVREEGPTQVGVAAVMSRAGLTHGGFYAHFPAKEQLVAATIGHMFDTTAAQLRQRSEGLPPAQALSGYIEAYLSPWHRDHRSEGCPMPVLASDVPRLSEPSRQAYAEGVRSLTALLDGWLSALDFVDPNTLAMSVMSELVGAISLARAEPDTARSDAILEATYQQLHFRLGLA